MSLSVSVVLVCGDFTKEHDELSSDHVTHLPCDHIPQSGPCVQIVAGNFLWTSKRLLTYVCYML